MKLDLRDMILVSLFAALMVVGAYIKIPTPFGVYITFQLFFAIYAGLLLKPVAAFMSQIIYILLGLIGLPVFSSGGGIAYIFNPTFGYIIGFAVTAWIIAFLMSRVKDISILRVLKICVIGYLTTYLIGNIYFYLIMNLVVGKNISIFNVFSMMVMYMLKDFVLLILASYTSTIIIPVLRKNGFARG